MKKHPLRRVLNSALALSLSFLCASAPAFAAAAPASTATSASPSEEVEKYPGGPIVAELVSRLLEQTHYAKKPIDAAVSKQFLENYLESYDYNHMILNKSDVDEFENKYAATLGGMVKDGDVDPAYEIYQRVQKRLEERVALVKRLTASTFTFTTDESVVLDRHESPWPTQAEAENLWRLRIKNEVLVERMAREKAEEAKAAAAKAKAEADKKVAVSTPPAAAPASAVAASTVPAAAAKANAELAKNEAAKLPEKPAKEPSIEETIDTRYDRLLRSYKEYDGSDILQDYLSSLTHVYDPHTDYLAASSKENFDISMKLSLVGIGAVLRSEDGYAKILSLVTGGPAETGKKLKPNDKVEAVAQGDGPFVEVVGMKLDKVVAMIRGEKGTTVRLRVIPADAADPSTRVVIPIVRDEIKLTDQEAKARVYTIPSKQKGARASKIGVLDLPSFYADMQGGEDAKSLTRDTDRLLAELKRRQVDAVVVDLRRDGGGSLAEAVSLTGLFIKDGPVVQVKDARGTIRVLRDTDESQSYDGPMVVLTSRGSASAAEIFAAAMQDYGRALIVGDKSTFGKGTVQSVLELSQYLPPAYRAYKPGALKITVQKFYRVSGGSTQNRGVIPDIHLPSAGDISDMTESAQKDALPYDEIEPAVYDRSGNVDGKIAPVSRESAERVAASKEFAWIREDLERWEKQKKDKSISLNEAKRLAERKADEDRAAERKKERVAMKEKPPAFEEITLAMLDGTAKAPAASTGTVTATPPPLDDDEGYERSPDAPDAVLNETLRIAGDLASNVSPSATAYHSSSFNVTQ
ncbi:MAG TPA: carboxy terminal-processing peptidase [Elusimicrobiota bacterium]|nr:carboxy terminal-processing peptidase [Elusimicrobiota bacterium]